MRGPFEARSEIHGWLLASSTRPISAAPGVRLPKYCVIVGYEHLHGQPTLNSLKTHLRTMPKRVIARNTVGYGEGDPLHSLPAGRTPDLRRTRGCFMERFLTVAGCQLGPIARDRVAPQVVPAARADARGQARAATSSCFPSSR